MGLKLIIYHVPGILFVKYKIRGIFLNFQIGSEFS